MKKINPETTTASLKVLRHKHVYYKLQRLLGMLKSTENQRLEQRALDIYTCFLQSMESHPAVLSTVGVAANHQQTQNQNRLTLTELDIANAEDILLIAASLL